MTAQEYALKSASQVPANVIIDKEFARKHSALVNATRGIADLPGCKWQVDCAGCGHNRCALRVISLTFCGKSAARTRDRRRRACSDIRCFDAWGSSERRSDIRCFEAWGSSERRTVGGLHGHSFRELAVAPPAKSIIGFAILFLQFRL